MKKKVFFTFLIIIVFLFPCAKVEAGSVTVNGKTYTYEETDDGSDGPDTKDIEYELTYYCGDGTVGSGVPTSEMVKNEEFGWMEYERDGGSYVVIAAATHELFASWHRNPFYEPSYVINFGRKYSHIHYFKYFDKIEFQLRGKVYNGIILDSCGASMFPQDPTFNRKDENNILDIFTGATADDRQGISGEHVNVTSDGSFSGRSNTKNKAKALFVKKFFSSLFNMVGDAAQWFINNSTENGNGKTIAPATKE